MTIRMPGMIAMLSPLNSFFDELQVGCQMGPLVDLDVVVELEAPQIPQADGINV